MQPIEKTAAEITETPPDTPKKPEESKTWHGHKLVRSKKFYDAETFFGMIKK